MLTDFNIRLNPRVDSTRWEYKRISESSLPEKCKERARWHKNHRSSHKCPYCGRKGTLSVFGFVKHGCSQTLKSGENP